MTVETPEHLTIGDPIRFWKILLWLLLVLGSSAALVGVPGLWSSYLFDICFPAFLYIHLRGLARGVPAQPWLNSLSPPMTLGLIIGITYLLESLQFLGAYKGYFDPFDYLAYVSVLVPCYVLDTRLTKSNSQKKDA